MKEITPQLALVGVMMLLLTPAAQASSVSVASLCTGTEHVAWACETRTGKLASLCTSKPLTATQGYIQYRYGTKTKTDLLFPATTAAGSQQQFRYGQYSRYMVFMEGIFFTHENYTYELRYDSHAEEKPAVTVQEILIYDPHDKDTSIACKKVSGRLAELREIVAPEKDYVP